jgi:hypothetical protein
VGQIRRIIVQDQFGQKSETLFQKCMTQKMAGRVAQQVKYLPGKHETLSSNPNMAKKKKKKKKKKQ